MNSAFLQAAASYFGINPEQIRDADWANDGGQLVVTFAFTVTEADMIGVVERMKAQREVPTETPGVGGRKVQHVDAEPQPEPELPQSVWVDACVLDEHQKQMGSDYRSLVGVGEQVLMQVAMLRPDQMPPTTRGDQVRVYGAMFDQLDAKAQHIWGSRWTYIRQRVEMATGVTSNADDFGGLPG